MVKKVLDKQTQLLSEISPPTPPPFFFFPLSLLLSPFLFLRQLMW